MFSVEIIKYLNKLQITLFKVIYDMENFLYQLSYSKLKKRENSIRKQSYMFHMYHADSCNSN